MELKTFTRFRTGEPPSGGAPAHRTRHFRASKLKETRRFSRRSPCHRCSPVGLPLESSCRRSSDELRRRFSGAYQRSSFRLLVFDGFWRCLNRRRWSRPIDSRGWRCHATRRLYGGNDLSQVGHLGSVDGQGRAKCGCEYRRCARVPIRPLKDAGTRVNPQQSPIEIYSQLTWARKSTRTTLVHSLRLGRTVFDVQVVPGTKKR